jgi:predicted porin
MNKKLLAIAVGSAMVAAATAATAGDEPTFYGKIHLSIDSMDNGTSDNAATPAVDESSSGLYVSSNSSRLGLKGAVDLDGGLKAIYKYEMSTDYSTAKDGLAGNRNAYLGLKGGFGQVIAGRHDMPFKTVGRKFDLFGDTIGDTRSIMRLGKNNLDDSTIKDDWADRRDNVIMYTNTFGAVGVKIALGQEENTDNGGDTGIGITYKQGPIKVMFANETHGKGNLGNTGTDAKDSSGNIIAGSYGMGDMTFLAGYMAVSDLDGFKSVDVTGYTLAGKFKSGMNTFKLQYTAGEADCDGCSGAKLGGTLTAIGVDHKLSKMTSVYAVYASLSNDADMNFQLANGTGHATTTDMPTLVGDSPSGFSLGMIHKF